MPQVLSRELQELLILILPQSYQHIIFHRISYMSQAQWFYPWDQALC